MQKGVVAAVVVSAVTAHSQLMLLDSLAQSPDAEGVQPGRPVIRLQSRRVAVDGCFGWVSHRRLSSCTFSTSLQTKITQEAISPFFQPQSLIPMALAQLATF